MCFCSYRKLTKTPTTHASLPVEGSVYCVKVVSGHLVICLFVLLTYKTVSLLVLVNICIVFIQITKITETFAVNVKIQSVTANSL